MFLGGWYRHHWRIPARRRWLRPPTTRGTTAGTQVRLEHRLECRYGLRCAIAGRQQFMGALPGVRSDLGCGLGPSCQYAVAGLGKFPHLRRSADALVIVLNILSGSVWAIRLHARGRRVNVRRWLRPAQASGSLRFLPATSTRIASSCAPQTPPRCTRH